MAVFADTSHAAIAIAEESSYGVNPATGAYYARFTSDSLKQDNETKVSAEVSGDRNPRGQIRTNVSASGDINFEFSDNNFDNLLEGALTSTFSTPMNVNAISVTISGASGGQFVASGTGAFTDAVEGQWVRFTGFSTNGTIYARIVTRTSANQATLQGTRDDGTAVTNEVGGSVYVDGSHMKLGTTKTSYTIERQWLDINVFELFTGMNVASAKLTIAPGEIINGSFSFLGSKQEDFDTSQIGTIAAAGGERTVNAVDNVEAIFEGVFTDEADFCFTEISFNIDSKLRAQNCIGELGASGIGLGVAEITGTIKAFLSDKTLIDKYLNFEESRLAFRIVDSAGNVMIFTFPQIKFATGQDVISGNAADGIVELTWAAEKEDGVSNSAVTIDRFEPAEVS